MQMQMSWVRETMMLTETLVVKESEMMSLSVWERLLTSVALEPHPNSIPEHHQTH